MKRIYSIYRNQGLQYLLKRIVRFCKTRISAKLQFLIGIVIQWCGNRVPNERSLVLFGTRPGRTYEDNSRYLYEYILENEPELKPVWVTHQRRDYKRLSTDGKPVVYAGSLKGIYKLMRASIAVTTHGKKGVALHPTAIPDSLEIIMAGHGDPVKMTKRKNKEDVINLRERWSFYTHFLTTSEFMKEARLKDVEHPELGEPEGIEPIFEITGYPRNDILLDPPKRVEENWQTYKDDLEPSLTILYAPTKQGGVLKDPNEIAVDFFPFSDYDDQRLIRFLKDNNILLLFRPHPKDYRRNNPSNVKLREHMNNLSSRTEHIKVAGQDQFTEAVELLPFVDVLISDYSSIFHDFLLLDRPILLIPYKYEQYEEARGFRYDYKCNAPGPIISDFNHFEEVILEFINGKDTYQEQRNEFRERVHCYQDSNSRERVSRLIKNLVTPSP